MQNQRIFIIFFFKQGHRRMVSSVAWAEDNMPLNLFSSGFDRRVIGWSISPSKENQ